MTNSRLKIDIVSAALTLVAGIVTLATVLLARDQLPISRGVARGVGFVVLYLGMALFGWAALHLKEGIGGLVTPNLEKLVVTGPFRFVRHPTYCGTTVAMVGAGLVTRSALGLTLSLLLFLPVEVHRARLEERALGEKFGEAWQAYASRTGFFLPRLRKEERVAEDRERISDGET